MATRYLKIRKAVTQKIKIVAEPVEPETPVTSENFLDIITKKNIKVTPIRSKYKKSYWLAGTVRMTPTDDYINVTLPYEYAEAPTPLEAVQQLLVLLSGNRKRK